VNQLEKQENLANERKNNKTKTRGMTPHGDKQKKGRKPDHALTVGKHPIPEGPMYQSISQLLCI